MTVSLLTFDFTWNDDSTQVTPERKALYAHIAAVRVQDIARQIWYSWDDPPRAWNKTPEVQAGTGNLYVAFWAQNTKTTTETIELKLVRAAGDVVLQQKSHPVEPGGGIGIEWTGDANINNKALILRASYPALVPAPPPTPEPTPEPTPMPVLPPVEIPDLPWYASWLTPVIQYIANFGTSVVNYVFAATSPLTDAANTLKEIYTTVQQIGSPLTLLLPINTNKARDALRDALAGNIPQLLRLVDPEQWFAPGASDLEVAGKLGDLRSDTNTLVTSLNLIAFMAELASLGQVEAAQGFVDSYLKLFPVQGTVSKALEAQLEAAWIKPIQRQINAKWLPERPDVNELINEVVKEVLTIEQFIDIMKGQGMAPEWSQRIWDAHFIQPDYGSIQQSYWRGKITDETLDHYLKLVDLDPRYNDVVWKALLEQIPPYQELVNERVKEVIDQPTFEKGLAGWGFKGAWGKNIWDAHFMPATWDDFLTAMRRKQTVNIPVAGAAPKSHTFGVDAARDIDVVKGLSELADYDPRYWDFFKQRMYRDPSYRMVMWGFESGAIRPEDVPDLVHRLGLWPQDEAWYTRFLMTFQERAWITKYITALATAYIDGVVTADELKKRVLAIPRNEAVANWIIKIADVRKEMAASKVKAPAEKLLGLADLKRAYREGLMAEDAFRIELSARGFDMGDVETMVQLINLDKSAVEAGGRVVALSVTELLNAWRYNVITEDNLHIQLATRGLSEDEINTLLETKKRQWSMVAGGD